MLSVSSMITITLLSVYIYGVIICFIRSYFSYFRDSSSSSSDNICVIFLESLLWPSYLSNLICFQNNNSIERQRLNQGNSSERTLNI